MRSLFKVLFAAIALFPFVVFAAGSQTFYSSGTFTVPAYGSLTVTVNGAGGGGGGGSIPTVGSGLRGASGGGGGNSTFNGSVIGYGGGGGAPGVTSPSPGTGAAGGSGSASGGDSNTAGAGAAGGAGGLGADWTDPPIYGGPGGAGGQASKAYAGGALTPGSGITVVVGSGGAGGASGSGGFYGDAPGQSGSNGSVSISWTDPPPASCSVTLSPSSVNQGSGSTLSWSSSNADSWLYINNVGYVGASGSTWVAPSTTTDYSCIAQGAGGTDGWHGATLTVHPSCTFNGTTITHGSSVTGYQSATVPYGSTCTSQTRTCSDGTLSGSYTYASCSVNPPANCTYAGVTVNNGSSATFYSQQTNPSGQLCSAVSQSRTCTNGTLSGSNTYQYASCSCTPSYSCSTNTIQYTNSSCSVSNVTTCTSPSFCSAGSSSCLYPPPTFNQSGSGTSALTGHLQAVPLLVPQNTPTKLYWNVSNVSSCSVTGSNGDHWSGTSSGSGGVTSSPIIQQTSFTLSCPALDGTALTESQTVGVVPVFQER